MINIKFSSTPVIWVLSIVIYLLMLSIITAGVTWIVAHVWEAVNGAC